MVLPPFLDLTALRGQANLPGIVLYFTLSKEAGQQGKTAFQWSLGSKGLNIDQQPMAIEQ
jgi:hypothetical protein